MSVLTRALRDTVLATAFATMGLMKLTGAEWEVKLFRKWGQSDDTRTAFGALEALSALLLVNRNTRRLGAASMALVSVPTLMNEIQNGDDNLALARFTMLGMAVSAFTDPVRRATPPRPTRQARIDVRRPASLPSRSQRLARIQRRLSAG